MRPFLSIFYLCLVPRPDFARFRQKLAKSGQNLAQLTEPKYIPISRFSTLAGLPFGPARPLPDFLNWCHGGNFYKSSNPSTTSTRTSRAIFKNEDWKCKAGTATNLDCKCKVRYIPGMHREGVSYLEVRTYSARRGPWGLGRHIWNAPIPTTYRNLVSESGSITCT